MVSVEDDKAGLAFSVAPEAGGGLLSLRVRRGGRWRELLYVAKDAAGWRGGAPWLFPAVGRTRGGTMPIHGFVMEKPWKLVPTDGRRIVCRTASDESTRRLYPFDFALTTEYRLTPSGLLAHAAVEAGASNDRLMPFSLGNHLTLALPERSCAVRSPARTVFLLDSEGFLTGETAPAAWPASLDRDPGLADRVVGGFTKGECWVEVDIPGAATVAVRQSAMERTLPEHFRFVFYSDETRKFFCPEPWYGEPDSLRSGHGLAMLEPNGRFSWSMEISVR